MRTLVAVWHSPAPPGRGPRVRARSPRLGNRRLTQNLTVTLPYRKRPFMPKGDWLGKV
jgi:hypothetical protein